MYRYSDSIRIEGGQIWNGPAHQERILKTLVYDGAITNEIGDLWEAVLNKASKAMSLSKLRICYDSCGYEISVSPYMIRPLERIYLVEDNDLEYAVKYSDRSGFEKHLENKKTGEEILIIQHQLLTDASYANIALLENGIWYTPHKPLLSGIRRAHLLKEGKIREREIRAEDIKRFTHLSLFNAMIDLGELVIPTGKCVF